MESSIGTEEQALVERIAEAGGATVGELASMPDLGKAWRRSTIQRMADRLVVKGWLRREKVEGVYRYVTDKDPDEVKSEVLRQFINARLGGQVSPLVSYLHGGARLSVEEVAQLRRIVEEWGSGE